jgi:hypothetical protein
MAEAAAGALFFHWREEERGKNCEAAAMVALASPYLKLAAAASVPQLICCDFSDGKIFPLYRPQGFDHILAWCLIKPGINLG